MDLIIARLPRLEPRERAVLCDALEDERDLARRSKSDVEALIGRRLAAPWDLDLVRLLAERDERDARARGISWVSYCGAGYPPLLRHVYDPPVVLFYRGSLPNAERPLVAIVGTRKPSPASAAQAFEIARGLARAGLSVVSGLALGIDAMAHRGCVEGGAQTFAVLGSGVDMVYPSSNRALARRALETGGALLSEYPPGTGARKRYFPARNRIISGLCRGTLVVEAPEKSGARITARLALEQNRDLWVASAGVADTSADSGLSGAFDRRGTARLAEEGAEVVYSANDILRSWNIAPGGLRQGAAPGAAPAGAGSDAVANATDAAGAAAAEASSLARSLGITL